MSKRALEVIETVKKLDEMDTVEVYLDLYKHKNVYVDITIDVSPMQGFDELRNIMHLIHSLPLVLDGGGGTSGVAIERDGRLGIYAALVPGHEEFKEEKETIYGRRSE